MITNKYIAKSLHKINGKVYSVTKISNFAELVIFKSGKNKRFICFSCFGETASKALSLLPKQRIKVRFTVESKEHNHKWYTNLKAVELLEWAVNENKINKQLSLDTMFDEKQYISKLNYKPNNEFKI